MKYNWINIIQTLYYWEQSRQKMQSRMIYISKMYNYSPSVYKQATYIHCIYSNYIV